MPPLCEVKIMADLSKLNLDGTDRDIKDAVAREKLTVVDPSAGQGLIQFGVDANGNYGYKKVGADTVIPFKTGSGGGDDIVRIYTGSESYNPSSVSATAFKFEKHTYIGSGGTVGPYDIKKNTLFLLSYFSDNAYIDLIANHDSSLLSSFNNMNMWIRYRESSSQSASYLYARNQIYKASSDFTLTFLETHSRGSSTSLIGSHDTTGIYTVPIQIMILGIN